MKLTIKISLEQGLWVWLDPSNSSQSEMFETCKNGKWNFWRSWAIFFQTIKLKSSLPKHFWSTYRIRITNFKVLSKLFTDFGITLQGVILALSFHLYEVVNPFIVHISYTSGGTTAKLQWSKEVLFQNWIDISTSVSNAKI